MDNKILKQAVELAEGWRIVNSPRDDEDYYRGIWYTFEDVSQAQLDALAAQLVRQVDALSPVTCSIYITPNSTVVYIKDRAPVKVEHKRVSGLRSEHDRTDNTITAIVESGVLK